MIELLEVKTHQPNGGHFAPPGVPQTIYFLVKPVGIRGRAPRVRIYDEDENFIEEFVTWTHMRAVFSSRGWRVVESTVWDDTDTYASMVRTT